MGIKNPPPAKCIVTTHENYSEGCECGNCLRFRVLFAIYKLFRLRYLINNGPVCLQWCQM